MEPRPAYIRRSAIEARHWGAAYALYRVRGYLNIVENGIFRLNLYKAVLQQHETPPRTAAWATRLLE